MKNRVTYRNGSNIIVFRLGKTSNKKIAAANEKIVQTYTFSQAQFEYIYQCQKDSVKPEFKVFFSLDAANCGDCPFAANNQFKVQKIGKCYTHKVMQYSGFISMLKSINSQFDTFADVPKWGSDIAEQVVKMCNNRYVRFGTYGEPTEIDLDVVNVITLVCKNWTGYTHQYLRKPEYLAYFMASVHNENQSNFVHNRFEGRSFIAAKNNEGVKAVICPASNEAGFISNCSKCGLCSGTNGKGKKDVIILEH